MESNLSDGNHSDSDLHLPPCTRFLAGFENDNSDPYSNHPSTEKSVFETRISDFIKFHLDNPNLSLEEIVEESSRVAHEAVKLAVVARAFAEEKAVIAAKAMAEAKKALDLVADVSDEVYSQDKHLKKKSKMEKQLPVKLCYNKRVKVGNSNTNEELVNMDSSPRTIKNSEDPNLISKRHNRAKWLSMEGDHEIELEEAESDGLTIGVSGDKNLELADDFGVGRKRGRMEQKKLPLSICSFRGLENRHEGMLLNKETTVKDNDVAPSMWKCKGLKAPEPNKVMEI